MFLGRISPEKRPDRAIAIAREVGLPLKIAANVRVCNVVTNVRPQLSPNAATSIMTDSAHCGIPRKDPVCGQTRIET